MQDSKFYEIKEEDLAEISAEFVILGEPLDLELLSSKIGRRPTSAERRGDFRPEGRPAARSSYWAVSLERARGDSIDERVEILLGELEPYQEAICELLKSLELRAVVSVGVTIHRERPEYCLSRQTLAGLASLGCEFCLDIFDYSPTESGALREGG